MYSTARLNVSTWNECLHLTASKSVFDLLSDPIVNENLPWKLTTLIDAKQWLDEKKGGEIFPITLKTTEEFIGFLGLVDSKLNEPEIGYVFHHKFHHNGYASEVVEGMVNALFQQDNSTINKIHAFASSINIGSQKVLTNNGFILHDNIIHRGQERRHYIRIKE
jgi:RimJ/RimL family protein N-acetyltransferase